MKNKIIILFILLYYILSSQTVLAADVACTYTDGKQNLSLTIYDENNTASSFQYGGNEVYYGNNNSYSVPSGFSPTDDLGKIFFDTKDEDVQKYYKRFEYDLNDRICDII